MNTTNQTSDEDRAQLSQVFDEVSSQLDDIQVKVSELERQFPGLGGETLYARLIDVLAAALECSSELGKYIKSASDEDWKSED